MWLSTFPIITEARMFAARAFSDVLPRSQRHLIQSFHSRKERFCIDEVKLFPDSNRPPIFHQRMEFRSPIGVPRTNFDVFVPFGLVSIMKRSLFRVVRLMENRILIVFGCEVFQMP